MKFLTFSGTKEPIDDMTTAALSSSNGGGEGLQKERALPLRSILGNPH